MKAKAGVKASAKVKPIPLIAITAKSPIIPEANNIPKKYPGRKETFL
jgi:hypothetical protein